SLAERLSNRRQMTAQSSRISPRSQGKASSTRWSMLDCKGSPPGDSQAVPLVRPGDVDLDAVALLGPIGADRDQLEAIASGLQGADNRRAHANHVPWPQVVDFAA